MLYLIWGIMNVVVLLVFIGVCFNVTKLVREKYGLLLSIVFVFGLLSFIVRSPDKQSRSSDPDRIHPQRFRVLDVILDENPINTTRLTIAYTTSPEGIHTPFDRSMLTTGFISGTTWKPISIDVTSTKDNKHFQYKVRCVVEWTLLAASVYSEVKTMSGTASIK